MGSRRSPLELYRDCMRLIKHMAGTSSPKAVHLKSIVSKGFRDNRFETDPARIQALKQGCVLGWGVSAARRCMGRL